MAFCAGWRTTSSFLRLHRTEICARRCSGVAGKCYASGVCNRERVAPRARAGDEGGAGAEERAEIGDNEGEAVLGEEERNKLWAEINALQRYLQRVVKAEKYNEAAELRDEIAALKSRDPYVRLEQRLQRAVEEERYLDAAKFRDELKRVSRPPQLSDGAEGEAGSNAAQKKLSPSVEGVSNGIRVAVTSFLVQEASKPEQGTFVFAYKVVITNELSRTVQLVSRHWKIRDSAGKETEVKGAGVVGKQPVLEPHDVFTYTSMCPLKDTKTRKGSALGSMRGSYRFAAGDVGNEFFESEIGEFFLMLPATA